MGSDVVGLALLRCQRLLSAGVARVGSDVEGLALKPQFQEAQLKSAAL
jgi:hypothetical protein